MSLAKLTADLRACQFDRLARHVDQLNVLVSRDRYKDDVLEVKLNLASQETLSAALSNIDFSIRDHQANGRIDVADRLEADVAGPCRRLQRKGGSGQMRVQVVGSLIAAILGRFLAYEERDEFQVIAGDVEEHAALVDDLARQLAVFLQGEQAAAAFTTPGANDESAADDNTYELSDGTSSESRPTSIAGPDEPKIMPPSDPGDTGYELDLDE